MTNRIGGGNEHDLALINVLDPFNFIQHLTSCSLVADNEYIHTIAGFLLSTSRIVWSIYRCGGNVFLFCLLNRGSQ